MESRPIRIAGDFISGWERYRVITDVFARSQGRVFIWILVFCTFLPRSTGCPFELDECPWKLDESTGGRMTGAEHSFDAVANLIKTVPQ